MSTKKFGINDLKKKYGQMTVAKFLRSWRLSEGFSQADFARKLGISPANLCDIEKNRKGVSIAKAHEIAEILGYPPTMLVELAIQQQMTDAGLKYKVALKKSAA